MVRDDFFTQGGRAIALGVSRLSHASNAAWCDAEPSAQLYFVCEAEIVSSSWL